MIEKMKKYSLLLPYSEYEACLEPLAQLGIVHPVVKEAGTPADALAMQEHLAQYQRIKDAIMRCEKLIGEEAAAQCRITETQQNLSLSTETKQVVSDASKASLQRIDEADLALAQLSRRAEEIAALEGRYVATQQTAERLEPWGDFDPARLVQLRQAGWIIQTYTVISSRYDAEWETLYNAMIISQSGGISHFLTITKEMPSIEADPVALPETSLSAVIDKLDAIRQQLTAMNAQQIEDATRLLPTLDAGEQAIKDKISFSHVRQCTEHVADGHVILLEGWVPQPQWAAMDAALDDSTDGNAIASPLTGACYTTTEPSADDAPPISLRNNKFAQLFEFIGELYDMPRYGSTDMTPYFAPFFAIFFGICFGDMGYGLLMVIAGFFMRIKKPKMRSLATLILWLGMSAMFFGFITGNFAGIELMKLDWAILKPIQPYMLTTDNVFTFALAIGVVQIIFGMFVRGISQWLQLGFRYSLNTFGWIAALVGVGGSYAALTSELITDTVATPLMIIFGALAAIGILLYQNPERRGIKLLLNIPGGLYNIYETATSLLGDVLSYIRLFALALSGSVMAIVFNQLAVQMSPDIPGVNLLVMAIILLIGHGMNIFMSVMSSFIHPMRLTFVEFYKNAGFEGGGRKYNPFKINK